MRITAKYVREGLHRDDIELANTYGSDPSGNWFCSRVQFDGENTYVELEPTEFSGVVAAMNKATGEIKTVQVRDRHVENWTAVLNERGYKPMYRTPSA